MPKPEPKTIVRQLRLRPDVFERIQAKCDELHVPVATYLALVAERSLGPIEGFDALHKDLEKLRDIERDLRGTAA